MGAQFKKRIAGSTGRFFCPRRAIHFRRLRDGQDAGIGIEGKDAQQHHQEESDACHAGNATLYCAGCQLVRRRVSMGLNEECSSSAWWHERQQWQPHFYRENYHGIRSSSQAIN